MLRSLPDDVRDRIRSGFRISSAAQCVDELVLNSLDAGATNIVVKVNLSSFYIQVSDNGKGIEYNDLQIIGKRYTTSKCHSIDDYNNGSLFGFRGETLSSLVILSRCLLIGTRVYQLNTEKPITFEKIFMNGNTEAPKISSTHRPNPGTTVTIHGFFSNLPVRQNNIREIFDLGEICLKLSAIALMHPQVSITFSDESAGQILLKTSSCLSTLNTLSNLFTNTIDTSSFRPFYNRSEHYKISGFISVETHPQKSLRFVYVNRRVVLKTELSKTIESLLAPILKKKSRNRRKEDENGGEDSTKDIFLSYIINLSCSRSEYDCLHSSRTLLEFKNCSCVLSFVEESISRFLVTEGVVKLPSDEEAKMVPVPECDLLPFSELDKLLATQDLSSAVHSLIAKRPRMKDGGSNGAIGIWDPLATGDRVINLNRGPRSTDWPESRRCNEIDIYSSVPHLGATSRKASVGSHSSLSVFRESFRQKLKDKSETEMKWKPPPSLQQLFQVKLSSSSERKVSLSSIFKSSDSSEPQTSTASLRKSSRTSSNKASLLASISESTSTNKPSISSSTAESSSTLTDNAAVLSTITESSYAVVTERTVTITSAVHRISFDDNLELQLCTNSHSLDDFNIEGDSSRLSLEPFPVLVEDDESSEQQILNSEFDHSNVDEGCDNGSEDIDQSEADEDLFISCIDYEADEPSVFTDKCHLSNSSQDLTNSSSSEVDEQTTVIKVKKSSTLVRDVENTNEEETASSETDSRPSTDQNTGSMNICKENSATDQDVESDLNMEMLDNGNEKEILAQDAESIDTNQNVESNAEDQGVPQIATGQVGKCAETGQRIESKSFTGQELNQYSGDWMKMDNKGIPVYIHIPTGNSSLCAPDDDVPKETATVGIEQRCAKKCSILPKGKSPFLPQKGKEKVSEVAREVKVHGTGDDWIKWKYGSPRDVRSEAKSTDSILGSWMNPAFEANPSFVAGSEVSHLCNAQKMLNSYQFQKSDLDNMQVLGQVDNKFIACLLSDELLVLFDQHAVHERVLLEAFIQENINESSEVKSTALEKVILISKSLFSHLEVTSMRVNGVKLLKNTGIELDPTLDDFHLVVRRIPNCVYEKEKHEFDRGNVGKIEQLVTFLLKEWTTSMKNKKGMFSIPKCLHQILASKACRGAFKFGDPLSLDVCSLLVDGLRKCRIPFQCAHGRPNITPLISFEHLTRVTERNQRKVPKLKLWRLKKLSHENS